MGVLTWIANRFKSRKTVLFAWELGKGTGHTHRLLAVASEFASRDCAVVFALPQMETAAVIRQALPGVRIVHLPIRHPVWAPGEAQPVYHYGDILFRCGYHSAEYLEPMVQQWRGLFDSFQPTFVVCDHSPSVVLAAAGRVPCVHIGSGFATPPVGRSFLPLFPPSVDGAREREAQVLRTINELHERLGTPGIKRVCELLGLAESFTCCLPELDPYKSGRKEPALGPVQKLPPPQPSSERESVFGYLNGDDPHTILIIESLVKAKVRCGLYVRQCPPDWALLVAGTSVRFFATPQKMADAAGAAAAVLHRGGLSTAENALAIGRPQFLFPRTLEQQLTADAVQKMGCGVNLAGHGNPGDAIRRALAQRKHQKEAAAVAARIASRPAPDTCAAIVQSGDRYLSRE